MTNQSLTQAALEAEVQKRAPWYHSIDLGSGVITPGRAYNDLWKNIRLVRNNIDYKQKRVLDIASYDGMWAFEAERLGASEVVATDITYHAFKHFLFCRDVLGSKVVPYYNISPYNLAERLDVRFGTVDADFGDKGMESAPEDRAFDIVHHLGLLYHLRDPLASLSQARSVIKEGGLLLLETGVVLNMELSCMVFNGVDPNRFRIYDDPTTWWAPTISCLHEMLRASLFEPLVETQLILPLGKRDTDTGRACLAARAVNWQDAPHGVAVELANIHRNPGLDRWFIYHASNLNLTRTGVLKTARAFLTNRLGRK